MHALRRSLQTTLICLIALLSEGCDTIYVVNRHAALQQLPDPTCVKSVLAAAPGVEEVSYQLVPTIQKITWSGIPKEVPPYTHVFRYTGSTANRHGSLEITDNSKGRIELRQCLVTINRPPEPTEVSAYRTTMQRIEVNLEARCGVEHLHELVSESCLNVVCPALTSLAP
jgi:hypothetical protein